MKLIVSLSLLAVLAAFTFANFGGENEKSSTIQGLKELDVLLEFTIWTKQFNRNYENINEEVYRYNVFRANFVEIEKHNSKKDRTYEKGVNQFSDMTAEEFKARHLTLLTHVNSEIQYKVSEPAKTSLKTAGEINWVQKGYVTSVKDQGQCGACWAFAALGPIQAMLKQQGKPLMSLSAQQVMDCSTNYGNQGCNGGWMDNAYNYIKDAGITTEDLYPYKGSFQKCLTYGGEYKIKGFVDLKDCNSIANSLMNIPIAVAVDASKFYSYKSGVFSDCSAKPMLNHAFTLVGMTSDYWLGKEQWGVKWGENGYIRIARNGSACGICQVASYPV